MADRISREEVAHVARLARLHFDAAELDELTIQLGAVLEHAADVEALDVSQLPPAVHPLPLVDVTRPDEPEASLDRAEVLAQAPAREAGQFRVPPVLGEVP